MFWKGLAPERVEEAIAFARTLPPDFVPKSPRPHWQLTLWMGGLAPSLVV